MNTSTVQKLAENANVATYGGAVASVTFWGLQVSEICAIISTLVAIIGLGLQFWVASRRIKKLESQARVTKTVIGAVAQSNQDTAKRVDVIEKAGQ